MSSMRQETARSIELLREADEPTVEDRARVRSALAVRIAAGAAVIAAAREGASEIASSMTSGGSSAAAGTSLGTGTAVSGVATSAGVLAKLGGVVVVAAGLVLGGTHIHRQSEPRRGATPHAVQTTASAAPIDTAAEHAVQAPGVELTEALRQPDQSQVIEQRAVEREPNKKDVRIPRAVRSSSAEPPASVPEEPSIERPAPEKALDVAAESALLSDAASALRSRDLKRALASLDDHATRFPTGVLAEERNAARIRALTISGDHVSACTRAHEFVRKFPDSPYDREVRAACSDEIVKERDK